MARGVAPIESERLTLISMPPVFLEVCLAGDQATASRLLDLIIPSDWFAEQRLMKLRLAQLQRDPNLQPWLLRAIGLRQERRMIGHIGFHTYPDPDYLQALAPGGVEFGYTVFAPFRQRGYATEACAAMMTWANREYGVPRFVVTISPDNLPSLRIAQHFGFRKVGTHIDEEDGPEDIFVREVAGAES